MKRPDLIDLDSYDWPYVTPGDLARMPHINCDPRTIVRMIDKLDGYRVGRNWRIPIGAARRAFPIKRTA
jgi:hypothetical protein